MTRYDCVLKCLAETHWDGLTELFVLVKKFIFKNIVKVNESWQVCEYTRLANCLQDFFSAFGIFYLRLW